MEVDYEITVRDWSAFCRYQSLGTRGPKAILITTCALMVVVAPLPILLSGERTAQERLAAVLVAVAAVPVFLAFVFLLVSVGTRVASSALLKRGKSQGLLGHHMLSIQPDCVVAKTDVDEHRVLWAGIERIVETKHYAFIYMNTVRAFIIPKRAFHGAREVQVFLDELRRLKAEADTTTQTQGLPSG